MSLNKIIHPKIQEELNRRELVLKRRTSVGTDDLRLTYADMAGKVPYGIMTTVFPDNLDDKKIKNVLLSYGEGLQDEDDKFKIFSDGFNPDGTGAYKNVGEFGGIRPVSGLKSINVEFQDFRGVRKAVVNWKASSILDLEVYNWFLRIGTRVAVQWGWSFPQSEFRNRNGGFIYIEDDELKIHSDLFQNPYGRITDGLGNFDAVGGTVSNFSYKLQDDGSFDCTTEVTAIGVAYNSTIDGEENYGGVNLSLSRRVRSALLQKVIDEGRSGEFGRQVNNAAFFLTGGNYESDADGILKAIAFDDLHHAILNLDRIVSFQQKTQFGNARSRDEYWIDGNVGMLHEYHISETGNFVRTKSGENEEYFVRWGWFEDNILSKYLSVYEDFEGTQVYSLLFRSLESYNEQVSTGELGVSQQEGRLRSVRIRWENGLLPINPSHSFFASSKIEFKLDPIGPYEKGKKPNKRERFFANMISDMMGTPMGEELEFVTSDNHSAKIRNIFISVSEIQESFGIDTDNLNSLTRRGFNKPDVRHNFKNVKTAITKLWSDINSNFFNIWNLELVEIKNATNGGIDSIGVVDLNHFESETQNINRVLNYSSFDSDTIIKRGIFSFKAFTDSSIVKNQSLEFSVPNKLGYSALLGSTNVFTQQYSDKEQNKFKILAEIDGGSSSGIKPVKDLDGSFRSFAPYSRDTSVSSDYYTHNQTSMWDKSDKGYWRKYIARDSVQQPTTTLLESNATEKVDVEPSSTESKEFWLTTFMKNPAGDFKIDFNKPFFLDKDDQVEIQKTEEGELKIVTTGALYDDITDNSEAKEKTGITSLNWLECLTMKAEIEKKHRIIVEAHSTKKSDLFEYGKLGLEIDGIGGLRPGDLIHTEYIKERYNKPIIVEEIDYGPPVYFQVFGLTQKVDDSGWVTSIDSVMRLNTEAYQQAVSAELFKNADYYKTSLDRSFGNEPRGDGYQEAIDAFVDRFQKLKKGFNDYMDDAQKWYKEKKEKKSGLDVEVNQETEPAEVQQSFFSKAKTDLINKGSEISSVAQNSYYKETASEPGVAEADWDFVEKVDTILPDFSIRPILASDYITDLVDKDIKKENEEFIKNLLRESEEGQPSVPQKNPGYPFIQANFNKSPFGSNPSALEARERLGKKFGFNNYDDYLADRNTLGNRQSSIKRKQDWDNSPEIW